MMMMVISVLLDGWVVVPVVFFFETSFLVCVVRRCAVLPKQMKMIAVPLFVAVRWIVGTAITLPDGF
jgi:hypothetical protein